MTGVLIWINGPFGGGKTATAEELRRRLPGSVVCDPEEAGFGLHRMMPRALREDFQDLRAWRAGVVEVLDLVLRRHGGPVIAPMTLVAPASVSEVLGTLRRNGHDVRHVSLVARRETVVRRLDRRSRLHPARLLGGRRAEAFALDRLDACLAALRRPEFAVHVETDGLAVPEVAESVAAATGLELRPRAGGRLRAWRRRTSTRLRHVRLR